MVEAAGGDNQACDEVAECWDMVEIWREWFTGIFGKITAVRHRSQNDDPPDLDLVFADRTIGMEHTHLLPEHLGRAKALMRERKGISFVPPISLERTNSVELIDIITGVNDDWSDVEDEWQVLRALLARKLREKMRCMPRGGIIGMVTHDIRISNGDQPRMAKIAHEIVNHTKFADFARYTLILLAKTGLFYSSLVRRGEDIRERSG